MIMVSSSSVRDWQSIFSFTIMTSLIYYWGGTDLLLGEEGVMPLSYAEYLRGLELGQS